MIYISPFSAITGHYLLLINAPKGIWWIKGKLLVNILVAVDAYTCESSSDWCVWVYVCFCHVFNKILVCSFLCRWKEKHWCAVVQLLLMYSILCCNWLMLQFQRGLQKCFYIRFFTLVSVFPSENTQNVFKLVFFYFDFVWNEKEKGLIFC